MSLALVVETLAFIYKARVFVGSQVAGMSMAQSHIHGIWITVRTFTIESLTPLVQVPFF